MSESGVITWAERGRLIDAVMVLIHGIESVAGNDKTEIPGLQSLLERLMGPGELVIAHGPRREPPASDPPARVSASEGRQNPGSPTAGPGAQSGARAPEVMTRSVCTLP